MSGRDEGRTGRPPVVVLSTDEAEALVAVGMLRANGVEAWMGNAADAGEVIGLPLGPGNVVVRADQEELARALLADVDAAAAAEQADDEDEPEDDG